MVESPYRAGVSQVELEACTLHGPVSLLVAPDHTRLSIGAQVWTVAREHLSIVTQTKRRPKKRSLGLRGLHLYVARAWPTGEFSVWFERRPGVVQRLLGLPPIPGMSQETVDSWRKLEKLAGRLLEALSPYGDGASAFELGSGQHRVFGLQSEDRLVVYARPVFREHPRRLVELHRDGTLILPTRKGDRRLSMKRGLEVIASGDRIQFCHRDGEQVAAIFLPWIGASARSELTERLQQLVPRPEMQRAPVRGLERAVGQLFGVSTTGR